MRWRPVENTATNGGAMQKPLNAAEAPRDLSRRTLLEAISLGALSWVRQPSYAQERRHGSLRQREVMATEDRNGNRSLPRRRLGRTDLMVTPIGCGGAGITDTEMLHRAIEQGINYLDTAPAYGDSEAVIGEVMRTRRDQVFLATKWAVLADWSVDRCLASLHRSLQRLKTDRIDLLQLHSVDTGPGLTGTPRDGYARIDNPHLHTAMERARRDGKVRFFGVSSHDPHRAALLKHAIDTGLFDAIMVAFNAHTYAPSGMPDLLAHAHKRAIGVIGMVQSESASVSPPTTVNPITARLAWMLTRDIHTVVTSETLFSVDSQDACLAAAKRKRP
jgi:diketogulonate reductase-like aldo/keto reductase